MYYIYVSGYNGVRGTIYLSVSIRIILLIFLFSVPAAEAEPYDTCTDAYSISTLPFVYSGTEANMPKSYSSCGAVDRHSSYRFAISSYN